jgi:septal ring factor EnvC (AmiA/AmiB activator)
MNIINRTRLLKVLALADSSHDGEALAAVRVARQLLAQEGLSFADITKVTPPLAAVLPSTPQDHTARVRGLETQVADLQARLLEVQRQLQERNVALVAANTRVHQLENNAGRAQSEVEKWRNLARETANKLWDIGQEIAEDRAVTHDVAGQLQEIRPTLASPTLAPAARAGVRPPAPPNSLLRERRFVRNSLLETVGAGTQSGRSATK